MRSVFVFTHPPVLSFCCWSLRKSTEEEKATSKHVALKVTKKPWNKYHHHGNGKLVEPALLQYGLGLNIIQPVWEALSCVPAKQNPPRDSIGSASRSGSFRSSARHSASLARGLFARNHFRIFDSAIQSSDGAQAPSGGGYCFCISCFCLSLLR